MVLPRFLEVVSKQAPKVDVRISALDKRDAFDLVDRGEIDLLIGSFRNVPKRIRSRPLYTDAYLCVIRHGHPLLGADGSLSLDAYVAAPHVLVTLAADDRGIVDEVLSRQGLRRRVATTVSDFHLVPHIVSRTDMIGHMPRRIAELLVREGDLRVLPPPIALPPWNAELYWGGVSDAEPGAKWFREQLFAIGRGIEAT
jgi:DNA-binding transcriptional LysR family regulator